LYAIVMIDAGALIVAWLGEHVFAIEPCILCLDQRIPDAIVAFVAAAAARLPLSSKQRRRQSRPLAVAQPKPFRHLRAPTVWELASDFLPLGNPIYGSRA
jgi:hypothetical protein